MRIFVFILLHSHLSILLKLALIILRGILVLLYLIFDVMTFCVFTFIFFRVKSLVGGSSQKHSLSEVNWSWETWVCLDHLSVMWPLLQSDKMFKMEYFTWLSDLSLWPDHLSVMCPLLPSDKRGDMEMFRMEYFTKSESWNFAYDEMRYRTWKIKQRVSARNKTEKRTKRTKITWDSARVFFCSCVRVFHPARMLNLKIESVQPDGYNSDISHP